MTKAKKLSQAGWTTMEYVVGAIALVGVISVVINKFGEKLLQAVDSLKMI